MRALVAAALAALAILPAAGLAAGRVRLTAAFAPGARLGASTALYAELHIDPRRASPVTAIRVLYPQGFGLVASGLGLATCRRRASDFQNVVIDGPTLGGCPPNAVLGYGTARAEVRIIGGPIIPELATLTVLAGPLRQGTLGLVVYVDGQHPFGAKLAYAGEIAPATAPFGGALAFDLPAIPSLDGFATVALVDLRLSIGSRAITYYEHVGRRTIAYHPDGIALPSRCPRRGFRFRAQLVFQDGSQATAGATVACSRLAGAAGHRR